MVFGVKGVFKDYDYVLSYNHNSSNVAETSPSGYQSQTALATLFSQMTIHLIHSHSISTALDRIALPPTTLAT